MQVDIELTGLLLGQLQVGIYPLRRPREVESVSVVGDQTRFMFRLAAPAQPNFRFEKQKLYLITSWGINSGGINSCGLIFSIPESFRYGLSLVILGLGLAICLRIIFAVWKRVVERSTWLVGPVFPPRLLKIRLLSFILLHV